MKKLFGIMALAAIAAAAGWNFSQSQNKMELSDLALANINALAEQECTPSVGCSCWWTDESYTKCCEGGWFGCKPCD